MRPDVRVLLVVACAFATACAAQPPELPGGASIRRAGTSPDAPPTLPRDPYAWVHFPGGECETKVLEAEVWDRAANGWVAHPDHPRIAAGSCHLEERLVLLNELRVRCVDPSGRRSPSAWVVGARARPADLPRPCPSGE